MLILGLTGSIGMGKSTAAAALRRLGVPVHDADAAIHRLIGRNGAAVPAVERAFPGSTRDGGDRTLAVARLMLDNFPHIKAFWIMQTLPMAQVMLQSVPVLNHSVSSAFSTTWARCSPLAGSRSM